MLNISRFLLTVAILVSSYSIGATASFADSASSNCARQDITSQQSSKSSSHIPDLKTITLMEETELYDEVYANWTTGSISPQTVEVVDRKVTYKLDGEQKSWYKIRTWLGDKWVHSNSAKPGDQKMVSTNMMLTGEETLYEFNAGFMGSSARISAQTVTVKGEWQGYYLIDTWLGERWIAPVHRVWTDIRKMNVPIPIAEKTELFTLPDEGCSTNAYLSVKTAVAFEQVSDWIHIRTNQGTFWMNPKLSVFNIVDAGGYLEASIVRAELVGTMTKLTMQVRLTDKLKAWSRPLQLTPSFALYDGQGMLLASNIGMGPIAFKADEINRFVVYAQGDVTNYALATSKIYTLNNTALPDSTASWSGQQFNLTLMDPNNPEVRVGEVTVARTGGHTIVRGKIKVALPNLNDVNAALAFYNDKSELIGTVTIKGAYGNIGPYGDTTFRFEAIGKGDFTAYTTVKLTVNSLIKPNQ